MRAREHPTLLSRLVRGDGHWTVEETCERFERKAREMGEDAALSVKQLHRWMNGVVDQPRPVMRRVAEAFWGHPFPVLIGPAEPPMADPEGRHYGGPSARQVARNALLPVELVGSPRAGLVATLEDMRRRELLGLGAALPVLTLAGGADDTTPQRVGAAEIEAVRYAAFNLDKKSAYGLSVARYALGKAVQMLDARIMPGRAAEFTALVGFLAAEIAWGEFEIGADAGHTLVIAKRIAASSGDGDLEALVLANTAVFVAGRDAAQGAILADYAARVASSGAGRVSAHSVAARIATGAQARRHLAAALETEPSLGDSVVTSSARQLRATLAFASFAVGERDLAVLALAA